MGVLGKIWIGATSLAVLATTTLSASADVSPELIKQAKAEGQLVVYISAQAPAELLPPIFEKKYGIKTIALRGNQGEIRERMRTEQATLRFVGDVHVSGLSTVFLQMSDGVLQPHGSLENSKKLIKPFSDNGTIIPIASGVFGIMVNTDLVKAGDEPKTWKDLLDPKWKGKIVMNDPRLTGAGYPWFDGLRGVHGDEYHKAMAMQNPTFIDNTVQIITRTSQGAFAVYATMNIAQMAGKDGLPIKALIPEEGAPHSPHAAAMIKQAPHPNAARLYMEFLLDKEVQELYADRSWATATGFQSDKVAPDLRERLRTKLLPLADPKTQDEVMAISREIYQ
jgi:iron(III) transport system substrate-binding protein